MDAEKLNVIQVLIPVLVVVTVFTFGGAILILLAGRRRSIAPRLSAADGSFQVPEQSREPVLLQMISALGQALAFGEGSEKLRQQLTRSGYHGESAATIFLGSKVLTLLLATPAVGAALLPLDLALHMKLYLLVVAGGIFFFIPNFVLRIKRQRRMAEIRKYLPDAVDLLEVCVTAGMGLDMAWNSVSDEMRHVSTTLADEMALVNLEIQLGATRTEAMRNMAARTGARELSALVALLVQSDRFGTSVADALRTFANSMRETRSQMAEEEAEKTAVKLLFPMVMFIFPVLLIVMVGPAGITLFTTLRTG
jgi:tight adherence protein C